GAGWELVPGISSFLLGVAEVAPNDAWLVGARGALYHYDGSQWAPRSQGADTTVVFNAVSALASNDVWAVGKGAIAHWNGSAVAATKMSGVTLNGVSALSQSDVWAVGNAGLALHWDGAAWTPIPTPVTQDLLSVHAILPNDVWAVGRGGSVVHWD